MQGSLGFQLHALTGRLDRAADRILRIEESVSYSRFLALFMVGELGASTQRRLAERLGVTEPSVSRMTEVLVASGFLDATASTRTRGNRRELRLTRAGSRLVKRCKSLLEGHLIEIVKASGVRFDEYLANTQRLLAALEGMESPTNARAQAPRRRQSR